MPDALATASPAPTSLVPSANDVRRRRRELVADLLLDGLRIAAIVARVRERGFVCSPRTIDTDVAIAQRRWSLEGGRRMQRRRAAALARIERLVERATEAGDFHAARGLLALETRILGMWQPAPTLSIDARTVHVSTPLPALLERLQQTVRAQFGELPPPPIEATLERQKAGAA